MGIAPRPSFDIRIYDSPQLVPVSVLWIYQNDCTCSRLIAIRLRHMLLWKYYLVYWLHHCVSRCLGKFTATECFDCTWFLAIEFQKCFHPSRSGCWSDHQSLVRSFCSIADNVVRRQGGSVCVALADARCWPHSKSCFWVVASTFGRSCYWSSGLNSLRFLSTARDQFAFSSLSAGSFPWASPRSQREAPLSS